MYLSSRRDKARWFGPFGPESPQRFNPQERTPWTMRDRPCMNLTDDLHKQLKEVAEEEDMKYHQWAHKVLQDAIDQRYNPQRRRSRELVQEHYITLQDEVDKWHRTAIKYHQEALQLRKENAALRQQAGEASCPCVAMVG